jgi:hypothetical protein
MNTTNMKIEHTDPMFPRKSGGHYEAHLLSRALDVNELDVIDVLKKARKRAVHTRRDSEFGRVSSAAISECERRLGQIDPILALTPEEIEEFGLEKVSVGGLPNGEVTKVSVNGAALINARVWVDPKTLGMKIEPIDQEWTPSTMGKKSGSLKNSDIMPLRYQVQKIIRQSWVSWTVFRHLENAIKLGNKYVDHGISSRIYDLETQNVIWEVNLARTAGGEPPTGAIWPVGEFTEKDLPF